MRKATLSLSVIDGGGRPLPLTLHRPAGDALCAPLLPLLKEAGAVLGVEEGPFGVPFLRLARPEGAGAARGEPLRVVHARGLAGVVKSKAPKLDIRVLALPEASPLPPGLVARVIEQQALHGGPSAEGRFAVGLDPVPGGLTPLSAPEAAARLAADSEAISLLAARPDMAEMLAAVAVALGGGAVTAFEAMHAPQGSSFAPRVPEKGAPGVMGLILAACAALGEAGQAQPATALHNAWLCALEEGLHTEETRIARPYAQEMGTEGFCKALRDRLGVEPRVLKPMRYAPPEEKRRPSLTVLR